MRRFPRLGRTAEKDRDGTVMPLMGEAHRSKLLP
jgi:hypothetical protein